MSITEGALAPAFTAKTSEGNDISLSDFQNKWVVLYFYPRDNTPGCTKQACAFRDSYKSFEKLNAVILGCSTDSNTSHEKFATKFELPFHLIADTDHQIAERYGVWKEKRLYGKTFMGIERTTFLISPEGKVAKIWKRVRVDGHITSVLEELQTLSADA